jgi:hypothetical protein
MGVRFWVCPDLASFYRFQCVSSARGESAERRMACLSVSLVMRLVSGRRQRHR